MTAAELAARIPGAISYRDGFRAPGVCHGGSKLKLYINSAPDGTILVKCFSRACSAKAIVESVGFTLGDLFPDSRLRAVDDGSAYRKKFIEAPVATVEAMLLREIERQRTMRLERNAFDTPNVRSCDVNAARSRVNSILSTTLSPVRQFYWECCAPHDQDPRWPECLKRAIKERCDGIMPYAFAFRNWQKFPKFRISIEERAATLLHEIGRIGAADQAA